MLVLSTGGKGTGVEAEGSNFPFVQPSPDIRGLLADLWLSHEYRDVALPLSVSRLAGFQQAFDGLASAADITIVDANDAVVFDSPGAAYYWKDWGARLRIHEWRFNNSVCRAVQHRAAAEPVSAWPDTIAPVSGVLDERTSELMPERLLILSQQNGAAVAGEIVFVNGWNVEITSKPYREPLRNTTALTFTADPGGGPGRQPGCADPAVVVRRIGGVGPDTQGNFTLAADKCYYVRQPIVVGADDLAVPTPATLSLGNDCDPCCECDDFVNVQRAILNIEAELRTAAALAEDTRDEFSAAKDRWNAEKACRANHVVKALALTTARTYADINVTVGNTTDKCLLDIRLEIWVAENVHPKAVWDVVPGTTFMSQPGKTEMMAYELERVTTNLDPTNYFILLGHIDAINPASVGRIKTRLVWPSQVPVGTMLYLTVRAYRDYDSADNTFPQTATYFTVMT